MQKSVYGVFALVLSIASWVRLANADAVTEWNLNASEAATAACISPADDPLHESRLYAIMHLAIHDALNALDRRSHPYALDIEGPSGASPEAAVAAAARDVLVPLINQIPAPFPQACLEAGVASVETAYVAALAAIPDGPAKTHGLTVGHAAAAVLLALRVADGSDTPLLDFAHPQGTEPGEWRFTPGFLFAFAPGWANVTPFVLRDAAQFRSGLPYALTSKKYAADLNEVKSLGSRISTTRTAEQTQIAHFWVDSSSLMWNGIARTVATAQGLGLWENARLFGLLNMALADGYIGTFETKYHYNYWRPVTAIQFANTDGNPDTIADPAWEPLVPTPPAPDYDSGHSVQGGAAAQVLKRFFGTDQVNFSTCSVSLPEVTQRCGGTSEVLRSFTSFTQAADENGLSRILVGFHFRKAVKEGIEHGRKIANRAVNRFLRPVH